MNLTDKNLYGFSITKSTYVKEIDATVYDLIHDKSGARLIFLDRADENTTFAIGFKTVPTDDSGVFHIMEHSVLCGSKKFPVKDPFTELLKSSVSTYLNALTAPDKTLYPVSSKNSKSFRGLVDVYLDAVFNPLVLENPYIFMQEGHRYEFDEDSRLNITGVVYNEMKGVYSTADEYADYLISKLVCNNGTYSYDSGGHPDLIPSLTHEGLVAAHDKFYHPSNATLFLDGDVETDVILPLIDSYLSNYERREIEVQIDDGNPPITDVSVGYYPIEKEEDPTDKTKVYICHNSYRHSDHARVSALSLATEILADLNTAPLTKAVLDSGLCDSFNFYGTHSYSLNSLNVSFFGVKDGKEEELIRVYDEALAKILAEGLSEESLTSALKRREFNMREGDFGTYPAGMVYMRSCLGSAMLGEDPADALQYEERLEFLKAKLGTSYYLDTLKAVIDSPRSTLILRPDVDFTVKAEEEQRRALDKLLDSMTEEEIAAIKETASRFEEWQNEEDSDEALATIPTISISDLNTEPKKVPTEIITVDNTVALLHPLHTGGIAYADLYFNVSDASEEELHYIRLFTELTSEWDTKKHTSNEFRNLTKNHLGAIYLTTHTAKHEDGDARVYMIMHVSCLEGEKENAAKIIEEYLYDSVYDKETLKKNVRQLYNLSLEAIISRGDAYANMRDAAKHSGYGAAVEHVYGYEYHAFLKELMESIDERCDYVLERFEEIRDKYFRRARLTLGITERDGKAYAESIINTVAAGGTECGKCTVAILDGINEGIAIPTTVSFVSRASDFDKIGKDAFTGACLLLQNMASFEILWNEIRLKNGAYDTGFFVKSSGGVGAYSYRDPSPEASVEYFGRVCDEILSFLDTEPDVHKYIIGVLGSIDTVGTPRSDGALATKKYLSGRTHEKTVKIRRECLEATLDELKRITLLLKEALASSTYTVAGPRDQLERIGGINRILDI